MNVDLMEADVMAADLLAADLMAADLMAADAIRRARRIAAHALRMRRSLLEIGVLEAFLFGPLALFVRQHVGAALVRAEHGIQHFVSPVERSATDGWLVLWGQ